MRGRVIHESPIPQLQSAREACAQREAARVLLLAALSLWLCCSCGRAATQSPSTGGVLIATPRSTRPAGPLLVTDTPAPTLTATDALPTPVPVSPTASHTAAQAPPTATRVPPTLTETPLPTVTLTPTPARQMARVVWVTDGDTIQVEMDGQRFDVRYIGVDSPEPRDRADAADPGVVAARANEELVGGQTVWLEKDVSETDGYDRLLRYVYAGELFVNAEMVRRGYAEAKRYEPDVRYQALFEQLEAEARAAKRGFWSATPTPLPTATVAEAALPQPDAGEGQGAVRVAANCCQFDAPDNDNENLNEEYVCLENTGTAVVDLSGWCVKDEKDHTYCFPAFALGPGATVRVHTGGGANTATDVYWDHSGAVWNNDGDTVYVYDAAGALVCAYEY